MKNRSLFISVVLGMLVGFLVAAAVGLDNQTNASSNPPPSTSSGASNYEQLDLFTKILHFVQNNYVEEVESKKLIEGAVKGMLATLDPHTIYMPSEQFREMQDDTRGKFGGLGIEITITDGFLTVVTPIEDTPAFDAGVEPGDRIIIIEDKAKQIKKDTKGMTLQDAVGLMRGGKNTKVTIHVARKGNEKLIPIEIKRDIVKLVSVKGGLIESNYAWLRITSFQENTSRDLRKKIEAIAKDNGKSLQGIVLDLRNNPGGLLEEAVNVSSLFLEKLPIVSTIGRNKSKKDIEYATGDGPFRDLKLVVLVNEASASASEIVAGALQDHKRGIVVGKTTFGKGSVQTLIDLENKAGLKLTVARYYTPNGRSIQLKGIVPDIDVDKLDIAILEKAKKGKAPREEDLDNHMLGDNEIKPDEKNGESDWLKGLKQQSKTDKDDDKRPIREKDGKKIRVDDPKEMVKHDFQLQQAVGYLKAWQLFSNATPPNRDKAGK